MKQVIVAAWVGIATGWLGFGWVLAEAQHVEAGQVIIAEAEASHEFGYRAAAVDILQEPQIVVAGEPNLRG